jgi:uncharacterized membrane protein YGL010W
VRGVDRLLGAYGADHRNPVNRGIHWVCIPLSVWALIALLWSIPFPWAVGRGIAPLNWSVIALVPALAWYLRLSRRLGSGLALFSLATLWLTAAIEVSSPLPLRPVAGSALLLAWIGQYLGHRLEGGAAAFTRDLRQLPVGPLWLMSLIYRRAGLPY